MREIKFRAWDKILCTWSGQTQHFVHSRPIGDKQYVFPDTGDRFIFEQYTGLKNQNGVGVYEGDIVKRIARDGDSLSGVLYVVVWVECSARFAIVAIDTEKYGTAEWTIDPSLFEVVGNIHENPELLEAA